ncbi:hypothetical protein Hanom_Chr06g00521281 [Helianthus anomalus]
MNASMMDVVGQPRRLAEIRRRWMHDNNELHQARAVQEELEHKAIAEAQKVRSELSPEIEKFRIDTDFVSQVQEMYQNLAVELEASNAKARAKQAELEEREEKLRELQQMCDSLVFEKNQLVKTSTAHQERLKEAESALDQSNAEVDSLTSRLAGLQADRITPAFQENRGKPQVEMADALEAAFNDPPAYAELFDKVPEDGVDSLRQMLDVARESGEE